ncbi:hypothetical protein M885DRAFT_526895 [Pelagophyceae sp. CCMP2097]|nr:hypothetical protein M885DRAFT_526895 [Pelagophyceae sp. CCMP2097]|mmetsp:Transcript_11673/g.39049  ORF Transcript_11673/g.39049 Transcript_11673/m.39049 type:complete len:465 (-) Transcript_11673:32-1426(-)
MRCFLVAACLALVGGDCSPASATAIGVKHDGLKKWKPNMQILEDEIDASLVRSGFVASPEAVLRRVLWVPKETVLILDNRVFVDAKFLSASKHAAHLTFAASVAQRITLPNVAYLFSGGTRGAKRCTRGFADEVDLPYAVITKMSGYGQCGVLVPNPYFGPNVTDWGLEQADALLRAEARPLAQREMKAFWRGNITDRKCANDLGNRARLAAGALSVKHPGRFDAFCASLDGCAPRKEACAAGDADWVRKEYNGDVQPVGTPYTKEMALLAKDPTPLARDFVAQADYSRYGAMLHLPGAFTGSYSRNLNRLWAQGAVVLVWDASYVEFYFPGLRSGETHVAVNACDAAGVMTKLQGDPADAARLAAGAKRVADNLLCPDCLVHFFEAFATKVRNHYGMAPLLDSAPKGQGRATLLESGIVNCSRVELVEVLSSDAHHDAYQRSLPSENLHVKRLGEQDCERLFR